MREDWKELPISDLLDVSIGGVWGSDPGIDEIDVSVYRQTEFDDDGKLLMPSDALRSITKNQLKSRRLEAGDVLMQKSAGTPTLPGRVVVVPPEIERNATCSNFLHLLRANTRICNPQFLFWYLWFNHQSGRAFEFQRGTNIRNLDLNQYLDQRVMLPPLQEQRRIVDLMSAVDSYIAALQQQADAARSARSAVLSKLLSAGGEDWTETTLGDVLAIQSGFAFSTSDWTVKGYPVIKINNVRDGKVSTESCSFIADPIPQGAEKFLLKKGDLLITLTGEIGATGTVEQNFPMYLNQRVGRVSIHKESKVLLQYLAVLFNYPPVRAEMWSLGKGNAQLNISPKSIHEIEVNLPPLSEQRWTIEIISSMDEVIRSTEQAVADAKSLRSGLLSDLLSGAHEIPESYDQLLGAA